MNAVFIRRSCQPANFLRAAEPDGSRTPSSMPHLRDPDLSIDQISAALGCTKRYLHMLFSDRGMTVSDYIWQTRLQNCRHELETQAGKTITDVAFSWGFSSSSHFSRVFRKYFGFVPSSIHKAQHAGLSPDVS